MPLIQPLSTLNLRSLSQSIARLDHYYQARFRNRFGPTVAALSRFIPRAGHILDIGANHGKFARNFARLHDRSCTVWCFEPLEYNYTLLESVTSGFPNVRVFRTALSDKPGTAEFFVPFKPSKRILPGSAHLGTTSDRGQFGTSTAPNVATLTIPTDTLDALAQRENLTRLDFIKIDVEGAEILVFRGGRATLSRFKPPIYCELQPGRPECIGATVDQTIHELTTLGYQLHTFPEGAVSPTPAQAFDPTCRDYLFLNQSRAAQAAG